MRLNVYGEELTDEVTLEARQVVGHEKPFYGIRVYLESPEVLGVAKDDDDRSAITLWVPQTADGGLDSAVMWSVLDKMHKTFAAIERRNDPNWVGETK